MTSFRDVIYPGFIRGPYHKYISKASSKRGQYYAKEWGWGVGCSESVKYLERMQHTGSGQSLNTGGRTFKEGDRVGFIVDFDKRVCQILFNGRIVGSPFTEIPDEIIPVICDEGMSTVSIDFLHGIPRA